VHLFGFLYAIFYSLSSLKMSRVGMMRFRAVTCTIIGSAALVYMGPKNERRLVRAQEKLLQRPSSSIGAINNMNSNSALKESTSPPIEDAVLTFAPEVPPPITRRYPATVRVNLVTDSAISPLSNKYKYQFWRFNGRCPGPFIRVRVGDILHVNITNNDKTLAMHSIDLHAVSGPGGGSSVTSVDYGQSKSASFKMLHAGFFLPLFSSAYTLTHC